MFIRNQLWIFREQVKSRFLYIYYQTVKMYFKLLIRMIISLFKTNHPNSVPFVYRKSHIAIVSNTHFDIRLFKQAIHVYKIVDHYVIYCSLLTSHILNLWCFASQIYWKCLLFLKILIWFLYAGTNSIKAIFLWYYSKLIDKHCVYAGIYYCHTYTKIWNTFADKTYVFRWNQKSVDTKIFGFNKPPFRWNPNEFRLRPIKVYGLKHTFNSPVK